jgi:hypothetical protein
MELLLSLDGGATFSLRLSAELDPLQRSFAWRVPELPAAQARVALRAEVAGREVLVAESADFVIEASPESTGPHEAVRREAGELWSVDAVAVPGETPQLPPTLGAGAERDTFGLETIVAELDPRPGGSTIAPHSARPDRGARAAEAPVRPTSRVGIRSVLATPLRI